MNEQLDTLNVREKKRNVVADNMRLMSVMRLMSLEGGTCITCPARPLVRHCQMDKVLHLQAAPSGISCILI